MKSRVLDGIRSPSTLATNNAHNSGSSLHFRPEHQSAPWLHSLQLLYINDAVEQAIAMILLDVATGHSKSSRGWERACTHPSREPLVPPCNLPSGFGTTKVFRNRKAVSQRDSEFHVTEVSRCVFTDAYDSMSSFCITRTLSPTRSVPCTNTLQRDVLTDPVPT